MDSNMAVHMDYNRRLLAAQRQQMAIHRAKHLDTHHSTVETNSSLMFKIITYQRKTLHFSTTELIIENQVYTGTLTIMGQALWPAGAAQPKCKFHNTHN